MAYYNVRSCTSSYEYIVSADTLNIGDVISFYYGEGTFCGTVLSISDAPANDSIYIGTYDDCCSCISNFGIQSFAFEPCDGGSLIFINLSTFCTFYGDSPNIGEVFQFFDTENDTTFCATMRGYDADQVGSIVIEPDEGPFVNCTSCGSRSANTETDFCQEICTESGTTVVTITPPHPIWTDGYGTEVTELNMITLGGMNGLNS